MAKTRSGRHDRRFTDTRNKIMEAALRLFIAKGYSATSLRDIADELGVTKSALYYHFPAKSDLAQRIFQPFIDDVDALLADLRPGQHSAADVLTAYAQALVPHRGAFAAMLRDASAAGDLDLEGASSRWLDRLGDLLTTGESTTAQRVRVSVAVGGLTRALVLAGVPAQEALGEGVEAALRALGDSAS